MLKKNLIWDNLKVPLTHLELNSPRVAPNSSKFYRIQSLGSKHMRIERICLPQISLAARSIR